MNSGDGRSEEDESNPAFYQTLEYGSFRFSEIILASQL